MFGAFRSRCDTPRSCIVRTSRPSDRPSADDAAAVRPPARGRASRRSDRVRHHLGEQVALGGQPRRRRWSTASGRGVGSPRSRRLCPSDPRPHRRRRAEQVLQRLGRPHVHALNRLQIAAAAVRHRQFGDGRSARVLQHASAGSRERRVGVGEQLRHEVVRQVADGEARARRAADAARYWRLLARVAVARGRPRTAVRRPVRARLPSPSRRGPPGSVGSVVRRVDGSAARTAAGRSAWPGAGTSG